MPRQRQHGGGHYISAPTSSFVIEIVGSVLSSACFFFFFLSWGPHLTLPTTPLPPPQFNFSNGEQPESLCDGSKPHCGLTRGGGGAGGGGVLRGAPIPPPIHAFQFVLITWGKRANSSTH